MDPKVAVRRAVYELFGPAATTPTLARIAQRTDLSSEQVRDHLAVLASEHAVVLEPDGETIRMAHPFTAEAMAYVVLPLGAGDDRLWWGGCAWDSFGVMAALDLGVRILTRCPHCGVRLDYEATPSRAPEADLVVRFPRPARRWWPDVVPNCTYIRTFCSRAHARSWTAAHDAADGEVVPLATVWRLALPWYGDRLAADYTPHSRAHNQALLEDAGLTGPFWELP